QIFGVPAVKLNDKGKLEMDSEDKSLRGMPSEAELKAIEKAAAKFEKDPAYSKLSQDQRHEQLQKFITQARIDTFKSLDREDKKKNHAKLVSDLSDSVAGGSALGLYKKDKDIKKGTAHVSINVASAKRTWVQHMARL